MQDAYLASGLSDYGMTIRPSDFVVAHFGHFPLQDDFIENIKGVKLSDKDKTVLKILNSSSERPSE